jgi:DNA-binding beta-propeller fold protein YncE
MPNSITACSLAGSDPRCYNLDSDGPVHEIPRRNNAWHNSAAVRAAGTACAVVALAMAGIAGISATASAQPPGTPFAYVAESGSGDVLPFDASRITSLGYPGRPIPITGTPSALLASANNQFVYVASTAGVTPIGTDYIKAGPLIAVPHGVGGMAITPDGKTLYVTTAATSTAVNTVVPVNTATRKAGKPVTFGPGPGAHPSPLVITPDGRTVYVASALGTVTPVSTATNKPGQPIRFGPKDQNGTAHLVISPNGKTLYAFVSDPGRTVTTVTPISTATGKAGKPVPVGQGPQAIVFSPDGKTAYVASTGEGPKARVAAKVTPVSTATNTPGRFISLGPTATAMSMTIMPDGAKVYVTAIWAGPHNNTVFALSTTAAAIVKEYWPTYPRAVAVTPDSKTAFIIDAEPGAFGVAESITTATNEFHGGFEIGKDPVAITIVPRYPAPA